MQRPTKKSVCRVEKKYFWQAVAYAIVFTTAGIVSSAGMILFPDENSTVNHFGMALFFGGFWSCWVLATIWLGLFQLRYRLIIDRKGIRQTGIFRSFFVQWHQIEKMRWFNFPHPGGVTLRGDFRKMNIHFGNFDVKTRIVLENLFAEVIPNMNQVRSEQFQKTKEKLHPKPSSNAGKLSPLQTAVFFSILFLLGISFICLGFLIHWRMYFGGALILIYTVYRATLLIREI